MENMAKLSALYGVPLEDLVQDICQLPAPHRREKPADPPEEQPKTARGKPLILTILAAMILLAVVTACVLFFQGQTEDVVLQSELQGEVIDMSSAITIHLLPPD